MFICNCFVEVQADHKSRGDAGKELETLRVKVSL